MPSKDYVVNWAEEAGWAILTGVAAVVLPMALAAQSQIGVWGAEDWKTWGFAVATAAGRVAVALALNAVRKLIGANAISDSPAD